MLKFSKLLLILSFVSFPFNICAKNTVIWVGGSIDLNSGKSNQSSSFENSRLPDAQISGGVINSNTGSKNYFDDDFAFSADSNFYIKALTSSENGNKYGAFIDVEADFLNNRENENVDFNKAYFFGEFKPGRFELGNNVGVNQTMKVGPASFARGAGGINGKYLQYVNLPMLADSTNNVNQIGNCDGFRVLGGSVVATGSNCSNVKLPRFILIPTSPISHGGYAQGFYSNSTSNNYSNSSQIGFNRINDGSFANLQDATKVSYYSPRVSGFQAGISIMPDTKNSRSYKYYQDNVGNIEDVISYALNYKNNFNNLGFGVSLVGEFGKSDISNRQDLGAYELGFELDYFGFTFGSSYGSWGDSLMPKTGIYSCSYDANVNISNQNCDSANYSNISKNNTAKYHTLGLAYKIGPAALSVTHLASDFQKNEYEATSLGFDYKLKKGLMPYFEVTKFEFESNQVRALDVSNQNNQSTNQIRDNKGYVALVGFLISF